MDPRQKYHLKLCEQILTVHDGIPNFVDSNNQSSIKIGIDLIRRLAYPIRESSVDNRAKLQKLFSQLTMDFLGNFHQLLHTDKWVLSQDISDFDASNQLVNLQNALRANSKIIADPFYDYLLTPDIIIGKYPSTKEAPTQIPDSTPSISSSTQPIHLKYKKHSGFKPVIYSIISCKWTIRSDRAQNTRTEALNLIRNRKGHLPHIVAVTAEPLPMRIAALALGTGDLDCVYHFALHELKAAIEEIHNEDQLDMLNMMVEGQRLRDISDLPFDLAA